MQDVRLRHRLLFLTPDQTSEHKLDTRTSRHETCRQTRLHKSRSHSSTCPGTFNWPCSTTPISSRPYRQLESVGTRIITTTQPSTSVGLRPAPHGDDQPEPGTKYCPPLPPRVRVSLRNGRPPSLYSWSAAPFEKASNAVFFGRNHFKVGGSNVLNSWLWYMKWTMCSYVAAGASQTRLPEPCHALPAEGGYTSLPQT